MQIVMNGTRCHPHPSLSQSTLWAIIERLESFGWRRLMSTDDVVCLEK